MSRKVHTEFSCDAVGCDVKQTIVDGMLGHDMIVSPLLLQVNGVTLLDGHLCSAHQTNAMRDLNDLFKLLMPIEPDEQEQAQQKPDDKDSDKKTTSPPPATPKRK